MRSRRSRTCFCLSILLAAGAIATARAAAAAPDPLEPILRRFADDYAADPSLKAERSFGIQVGEAKWQVTARPASSGRPATVELGKGFPAAPTFFFTTDAATLGKIDRGELNALTAMGKARESDFAPLDVGVMEGYQPGPSFVAELLDTCFHFWTRGFPELIPFGGELTRQVHGAQAVIFFYQPGFRSGWFQVRPGQHVNADPKDQSNPFPTLLVPTKGRAKGKIGGVEISLDAGAAILIPPDTPHEFWNPFDEPAEGVLLMFGDGA